MNKKEYDKDVEKIFTDFGNRMLILIIIEILIILYVLWNKEYILYLLNMGVFYYLMSGVDKYKKQFKDYTIYKGTILETTDEYLKNSRG